jgi:hypothetical protein
MLQAQKEEKLRKKNDDLESRHNKDTARFDALVRRSKTLVAKANMKIDTLEQETTLRISCLDVENRKSKVSFFSQVFHLSFLGQAAYYSGKNCATRAGNSRVNHYVRRSRRLGSLIFYYF